MNVTPTDIIWIIPHDTWIFNRSGKGDPFSYADALLKNARKVNKACMYLEDTKIIFRLDESILPT